MSQPNITPLAGTTPEGDAAETYAVKPELVDGQDVCLALVNACARKRFCSQQGCGVVLLAITRYT